MEGARNSFGIKLQLAHDHRYQCVVALFIQYLQFKNGFDIDILVQLIIILHDGHEAKAVRHVLASRFSQFVGHIFHFLVSLTTKNFVGR